MWMQFECNSRIVVMVDGVEPRLLSNGMVEPGEATVPFAAAPMIKPTSREHGIPQRQLCFGDIASNEVLVACRKGLFG